MRWALCSDRGARPQPKENYVRRRPASASPALMALSIAPNACTTPAMIEPHADPGTQMNAIAQRVEQACRQREMTRVIENIGNCYAASTSPVIGVFALRDCLVLDYITYRSDFTA